MRKFLWALVKGLVRFVYTFALALVGLVVARTTYLPAVRWVSETRPVRWIAGEFGSEPDLAYWHAVGRSAHDGDIFVAWLLVALIGGFICFLMIHCTIESHPQRGSFWDNVLVRFFVRVFDGIRRTGTWLWETIVYRWLYWVGVGMIAWPALLAVLYYAWPWAHRSVMGLGPWLAEHVLRPVGVAIAYAVLFLVEVVTTGYWP